MSRTVASSSVGVDVGVGDGAVGVSTWQNELANDSVSAESRLARSTTVRRFSWTSRRARCRREACASRGPSAQLYGDGRARRRGARRGAGIHRPRTLEGVGEIGRRGGLVERGQHSGAPSTDELAERIGAPSRAGRPQCADAPGGVEDSGLPRRVEEHDDAGPHERTRDKQQPAVVEVERLLPHLVQAKGLSGPLDTRGRCPRTTPSPRRRRACGRGT